ncbi:M23 family metallopeptidase [Emticicia oligotrophica]|uniref:M23 family metallopeptidase n=1 Tax=Emticicia oligotrophica TaxID=312279 RepID=UPI00273CCB5D|nr:M23 family metallopeptidase [Emticicia oligotrophica]
MQKYCYYFIFLMFSNTLFAQNKRDSFRSFIKNNSELIVFEKIAYFRNNIFFEIPCILPLKITEGNRITSFYGERIHPVNGALDFHHAIDIAAKEFDEVFSTANGMIIESNYDKYLGEYIVIEHPNGYQTIYGHLSVRCVDVGEIIYIGEKIGAVGKSGRATGFHLHYGIKKNGQYVNPLPYLFLFQKSIH